MKLRYLLLLAVGMPISLTAQDRLYNMSLDDWSKKSGTWYPRAENATAAQYIWDSANKGMSIIGANCTTPEYKHVAVAGEGKAAARIESRSVFGVFVAGNLFTGSYGKTVGMSGAVLNFGTPFTQRPKSLSGWYHYSPKTINYAKEPHKDKKGQTDQATIEVTLTDWSEPLTIDTTKEKFIDSKTNPHAIGYGRLIVTKDSGGYVRFEIPIEYKGDAAPSYVVISAASSRYGEFFTGASGSVLYLDELQFNY